LKFQNRPSLVISKAVEDYMTLWAELDLWEGPNW